MCVYETVGSETPSEARQRRLGELQSRGSLYEELFDILRSRPEQDVASIVARIRSGADVEDILRFVKEGDALIELSVAPQTEYRYSFPYKTSHARHPPRQPKRPLYEFADRPRHLRIHS